MRRAFNRLSSAWASRLRTSGEPGSDSGASSFHLLWDLSPDPLSEVSATLEILTPPRVRRLYFWALQVSFAVGPRLQGGAHLGLQWNTHHPGSTAVNWGGYEAGGSQQLRGSDSLLRSARRDPNTRDYPWVPGHRYRLEIVRADEAPAGVVAWRGSVTHVESGEKTVVRDLYAPGTHLVRPMVWSEVFARCEHPTVVARWGELRARDADGREVRPAYVRVNYQSRAEGGCDNTTVGVDELGVLQITQAERRVPQGAMLPVPGTAGS